MSYFKSRGLRGSTFEEMINLTNEAYRDKKLALIQKIPTSITPVELSGNAISLAYFEKRSTVDYIGVVQGIAVCFDAKETELKSFPLRNIHHHQFEFMLDFRSQNGVAFLIVRFSKTNETFLLPLEVIEKYIRESEEGQRKSIPYNAFEKKYLIGTKQRFLVHYLEALSTYLEAAK
ncbi:MAG: Holliday junction resolvase RecU [Defluviitaleaceae bacterium]|nr:Holliday junction resolvase RecU [Defluviitaleaceae bacterium]